MRILPDRGAKITAGDIFMGDKDLLNLSEDEMCKVRGAEIAMIFQDPMTALNPTMRVGDQIAEVIKLHDTITKAEAKKRAIEMLNMVGITAERYDEYPHQFSGGMGDSRHPFLFIAAAAIINLVLDLLFVAVFHMAVFGAALATVIGQGVSFIWGFIFLVRRRKRLGIDIDRSCFLFDRETMRKMKRDRSVQARKRTL